MQIESSDTSPITSWPLAKKNHCKFDYTSIGSVLSDVFILGFIETSTYPSWDYYWSREMSGFLIRLAVDTLYERQNAPIFGLRPTAKLAVAHMREYYYALWKTA